MKTLTLEEVAEIVRQCVKCPLCKDRTNAVPGEGSPRAAVMFIGEGPGSREDLQGRPFVGRAGQLLDEMIASIGLRREDVYITNVVKCRPVAYESEGKKDRKPVEEEIAACEGYLDQEIALIKPKVICALGDTANSHLLKKFDLNPGPIGRTHGKVQERDGVKIVTMYHPAAALYTASVKDEIRKDFEKLKRLLHQPTLEDWRS